MEDLKKEIDMLCHDIFEQESYLRELQNKLAGKKHQLQNTCVHACFIAESDGDYHRSTYGYTCIDCKLYTKYRPKETSTIIYK